MPDGKVYDCMIAQYAFAEEGEYTIKYTVESESGVKTKFTTGSHSAIMVPLLTYGASAEKIGGILDNTELNAKMRELLGL